MISSEEVGGALEKLVGFSEMHSTSSQQTHLDEISYVLQSLGSTNTPSAKTPEHCTHTPSDADHRLDSRSTHDTHTPIAVKPHLEKTEPLAESTSLVSTDADGESHPTDSLDIDLVFINSLTAWLQMVCAAFYLHISLCSHKGENKYSFIFLTTKIANSVLFLQSEVSRIGFSDRNLPLQLGDSLKK